MFCLAANTNAPHNNTPMLGVHEPKSHFASVLIFSLFAATWVIAAVIRFKFLTSAGDFSNSDQFITKNREHRLRLSYLRWSLSIVQ